MRIDFDLTSFHLHHLGRLHRLHRLRPHRLHGIGLALALLVCAGGCGDGRALGGGDMSGGRIPAVHRAVAPVCTDDRPAYNCNISAGPAQCKADSDCTAGRNGRCVGNGHDGCTCSYDTCTTDADCKSTELCDCRSPWHYGPNGPNRCLPTNCRTDADCGPGGWCSPSYDPGCGRYFGVTLWRCHTPRDLCLDDSDCMNADGGWGMPYCGWRPETGRWECSVTQCVG